MISGCYYNYPEVWHSQQTVKQAYNEVQGTECFTWL